MKTGWLKLSGKWYYLNGSGVMADSNMKINGKINRFKNNGEWLGVL